jgi:hypothetical protein
MKRTQYNHASNLSKGYTSSIVEIITANGGELVQTTNHNYSRRGYGATWLQRVEYKKDGESRIAYQFCGDGLDGEYFGTWFWSPAEHNCSLDFADRLCRPEWAMAREYDEMPSDMAPKFY